MRGERGAAGMDDLVLLLVAVVAFSLFFASVAHAHVAREAADRGERLQAAADALLDAVLEDPRWTQGRGLFPAEALDGASPEAMGALAAGSPYRVDVRDLMTGDRWTFGGDSPGPDYRVATSAANVLSDAVHPATVVVTVWRS